VRASSSPPLPHACADTGRAAAGAPDVRIDGADAWDDFVRSVNGALNALDLEFRHQPDEASGQQLYAIVRPPSAHTMSPNA
jgi:hypothetical protein